MTDFHVYDTTLRDGAQQEGLNLSVADKLAIASHLDELGVGFIEGGWPGANPKDTEFFARAADRARPAQRHARGVRRHPPSRRAGRPTTRRCARCSTPGPGRHACRQVHTGHVERALRTTLAENLAMIRDTVSFLRGEGRRVFLDAEHFFDGYATDRDYALEAVRAATEAGAEVVALCDTNGGMLPGQVADVVDDVRAHHRCTARHPLPQRHRLRGRQLAGGGRRGRHPRAGHASTATASAPATPTCSPSSPTSSSSRAVPLLEPHRLQEATRIAHAISEITNVPPYARQPYVGRRARSRTRPACTPAPSRSTPTSTSTSTPSTVGNDMRMLVSDMAGRASIELKGRELGFDLDPATTTTRARAGSANGQGRGAARLHLRGRRRVVRAAAARARSTGRSPAFFEVESWRVITDARGDDRRRVVRGDGQAACAAGERVRAHRRGQRPGQRARPRPALGAGDGLPRDRASSS